MFGSNRREPKGDELIALTRKEHAAHDAEMLAAAVSGLVDTLRRVLDTNPDFRLKKLTPDMVEKAAGECISRWIVTRSRIAAGAPDLFGELGNRAPVPEFLS